MGQKEIFQCWYNYRMGQTPKSIWGMLVAAMVAAVALAIIILKFDPYTSNWIIFGFLFFSFFVLTTGILVPILYFSGLKRQIIDMINWFNFTIRQSLIISITLTILFVLQTFHVLLWWNSLLILVIAVILSMYFKN